MSLSRLVFRAGYGIRLYGFLIIAFLSTFKTISYAKKNERQPQSTVKTLNLLYSQYTLTELLIAIIDAQSIANAYYYGVTYAQQGLQRMRRTTSCALQRKNIHRKFCTGGASGGAEADITTVPLSKAPPGFPAPKYASLDKEQHETRVTTLENGLRVASENKFGQFCTVGVVIDSGSRYEVNFHSGISHFLEKLAFSKTSEFESRDKIQLELERHGGICDCQGSRDTMIYAMSGQTKGLSSLLNLLSEVVNRPDFTKEELEFARSTIGFELESLWMNPNPDLLIMEMIHDAGYRNNTLGLPKLCPQENITKINSSTLYTYLKNYHMPERMVLAGVGMDHDVLVKAAEEHFVKKPVWMEEGIEIDRRKTRDNSISQYTGGIVKIEADLSDVSLGPTPMPELAHFVIGLESCSHKDDDFVAYCVLNMMMGGGGSFSAGGPGKGMYTRLYLNVLNQYHWIHSATAYNHAYEDSGLFCIHASAHPDQLSDLTEVIVKELAATSGRIFDEELNRAKTQLQSMLMMNLEQRPVVFEDIGRQVLATGHRHQPEYYYEKIGKITVKDIQRVAERMLRTKPAVAAYGNTAKLPGVDDIQAALLSKAGKSTKRFSVFGR